MVFFTCNACGSSLKKNQVEKHYQNECRNCEVLSCMDCGRDFYGDEYASHTKCISEAEKYQGALYKDTGGGGATKGERKQQEWLERVKHSTATVKVSSRISGLLERIAEYPNVPRKKKKFENFVRNSINVRDQGTLSQLWDAFNEATKEPEASPAPSNSQEISESDVGKTLGQRQLPNGVQTEKVETCQKKKKHKKDCAEETDETLCSKAKDCNGVLEHSEHDVAMETPKKKKKKDKHRECEGDLESMSRKKKRKHVDKDNDETNIRTKKLKVASN